MQVDIDAENGTYVDLLYEALQEGIMGLEQAPKALKDVIQNDRWRSRRVRTGQIVKFARFSDFVAAKPIDGMGTTMELIDRIASVDKELETLVAAAKVQQEGGHRNPYGRNGKPAEVITVDNIHSDYATRPSGTSSQRSSLRLSRQAPELHSRVLSGELSPHAAMIQAGFRKKTMTLPCDVESLAVRLAKIYDLSNLTELVTRLLLTIEDAKNKGECE